METDGALIGRSARGQPDAFAEVVRRHEVAVHGFLARRAGREAADELLGEVWVRAFGARGTFRPECDDALPWLYGIARNVLRAHWRAGQPAGPPYVARDSVDPWDDVIDRLDSGAWARPLKAALRELRPYDREVLLLVAWEELTPAEAAVVLGIPQGTARSRLHRARSGLRAALAHIGAEDDGETGDDGEEDACPPRKRRQSLSARTR